MHQNPVFRKPTVDHNIAFAVARGFGMLTIASPEGLLAAHLPFLISKDGLLAELHLSNANPILKHLGEPVPCLLAVSGPDAYISPDWYRLGGNEVPTWDYVAVHIRGLLRTLPSSALPDLLDRLSVRFESELTPKPVWRPANMDAAKFERMQRGITALSIAIEKIEGTWKLDQNMPEKARKLVADKVKTSPTGFQTMELSRLIAEPPAEGTEP